MKKALSFLIIVLVCLSAFIFHDWTPKVSAQRANGFKNVFAAPDQVSDSALANEIQQLTNRSTDGLIEQKLADGGYTLDLQNRFQNVLISKIADDGEPAASCVASLGEANRFFGRNLRTGEALPSTAVKIQPTDMTERLGMSQAEYEFYKNMIENAAQARALNSTAATITIVNNDGAGEGFNDATPATAEGGNTGTTLGQQRLNLFNFAAGIWGAYLDTNVQINVRAQFDPLTPCSTSGGVLGSAGTVNILRDFPNAEFAGTWYPAALANKRAGSDLIAANPEINATFNSSVDTGCLGTGTRFYYGLDNTTPSGRVNLLVTLLHEMGHGLGFQSFVNGTTGTLASGFPDVFTRYMYDQTTGKYWYQMTDAERLTSTTNQHNVFWDGANVKIASSNLTAGGDTANGRVQLYTPTSYESGSSISHWDTAAFPNLLMEPNITRGLPLTLDLTRQEMLDIGWYRDTNNDLTADTITNVAPNSSVLTAGSTATVSWTNGGGFSRNVNIELSTDGGATFPTVIATDVTNVGSYSFAVPNNLTSQAKIRVREADFVAPLGVSANFTINAAAPLLYSVTGRVFYNGGRAVPGRVIVVLQGGGIETRYVPVNNSGYFRFTNVPAGASYTISIIGKNYKFTAQTVNVVNADVSGLTFTAQP